MKTAILGATGLVGRVMLKLLEERPWADEPPLLLAGERSAGSRLQFRGGTLTCRDAAQADWAGTDIALFSAGGAASRVYAPRFAAAGAWVIDNSSAHRKDPRVPLVVPEVNGGLVPRLDRPGARDGGGIIANPNCSTIQIAIALAPLEQAFGLAEVQVTTLQAVSGAGRRAVEALARELPAGREIGERLLAGDLAVAGAGEKGEVFPRAIAGNAIPEIGPPLPDGSFEEEAKVVRELRKILDRPQLSVCCTATRVPVWNGHSAAVRAVLRRPATPAEAVARMGAWPGLVVDPSPHGYATPAEASGDGRTRVGRVRRDPGREDALLFWVVADNLLKGAALNALQIADLLAGAGSPAR
jgi:aspartate-semialdehyde dehydrogenase